MMWGMVLGTFCGVVASLNPNGRDFRQRMDALNAFMGYQDIPEEMQLRLREYFVQSKHLQIAQSHNNLLELMSPMLQGEVVWQISERWLRHVWFLKDAEDGFMVQLALNLQAAVFAPHEQPPVGNLYIVHRGLAIYNGKVLSQGKVWGEDMIITNEKFRTEATAWAITYLDVMTISRNDFMDLALTFPPSMKAIRIAAYKMSFSREIILRYRYGGETKDGVYIPSLNALLDGWDHGSDSMAMGSVDEETVCVLCCHGLCTTSLVIA